MSMLISDEYRKLNENLHETNKHYGNNGAKWAKMVMSMTKMIKSEDVLDYGCGKGTLAQNLPFPVRQYDPAIPKYATPPDPAHIVVCTDVLEHIEPELIDNVLADLARLTKSLCLMNIANRPAKKILADGRNAHLIQQDEAWWLSKLFEYFHILQFNSNGVPIPEQQNNMLEYLIIATPKATRS